MAKIAVIGCGGTGSYLLPILLRTAKPSTGITLFDGDAFTEKNLDRQLFRPDLVGVNKALAMKQMYPDSRIEAKTAFLRDPEELKDFDLIFACPDNHIARSRVLTAVDSHESAAIICGNEYNSASAMVYHPEWKGTPLDPRVRYPEILTDKTGSPVDVSCTGEALESAPQLALANNTSAVFAMQLMHFWFNIMDEELEKDEDARKKFPVEMNWVPAKVSPTTIEDIMSLHEEREKEKRERAKNDKEKSEQEDRGDPPKAD